MFEVDGYENIPYSKLRIEISLNYQLTDMQRKVWIMELF